jgi:hypothetical protein
MKTTIIALIALCTCLTVAGEIPGPLGEKGELLFSDNFDRNELGPNWKSVIPTFTVDDGVLKGSQTRDDHGSVGRVYRSMKDVVVEFKFQLVGSRGFNVVFDDKNHKSSHAGHICRVAITRNQIRLGDDKEGIMRNDIFAMRRSDDPEKKAKADKLLQGRTAVVKVPVESSRWYNMRIEIVGDRMRVSLDDEPVGFLQSPGLAHPTKESLHFTVIGRDTLFDNVRIWKAK